MRQSRRIKLGIAERRLNAHLLAPHLAFGLFFILLLLSFERTTACAQSVLPEESSKPGTIVLQESERLIDLDDISPPEQALSIVSAPVAAVIPPAAPFRHQPGPDEIVRSIPLPLEFEPATQRTKSIAEAIFSSLHQDFMRGLQTLFAIREVRVTGSYHVTEDELKQHLGLMKSKWFWSHWRSDLGVELKAIAWVENAKVEWGYFPFTLSIDIEEADPWMVVEYGSTSWLVSRNARLLQPLSTLKDPALILAAAELPRLDGIEAHQTSNRNATSPRLNYALRVLKLVELAGGIPGAVDRYTLLPEGGLAASPQSPTAPVVVLEPETYQDAVRQLEHLGAVLADLKRRNQNVERIDLRFNNRAILS